MVLTNNRVSDIEPLVENTKFRKLFGDCALLYLKGNPLSNTSINTHIPTLQARGVIVDIGPPTQTLVKVSGDNQQVGSVEDKLDPFVVEVQDQNCSVISEIEVTFSVTTGDGTLSMPSTMTDVNGRAESTLTLGPGVGTNTVSVSAEGVQGVAFTVVVGGAGT